MLFWPARRISESITNMDTNNDILIISRSVSWNKSTLSNVVVSIEDILLATRLAKQISDPKFHLFSKLPKELQTLIWKTVAFHERNLMIFAPSLGWQPEDPYVSEEDMDAVEFEAYKYISPMPIPALLHATKEARVEGLKHYSRCFNTSFLNYRFNTYPQIYLNPESDRVALLGLVTTDACYDFSAKVKQYEIRKLALNADLVMEITCKYTGMVTYGFGCVHFIKEWFYPRMWEIAVYFGENHVRLDERICFEEILVNTNAEDLVDSEDDGEMILGNSLLIVCDFLVREERKLRDVGKTEEELEEFCKDLRLKLMVCIVE